MPAPRNCYRVVRVGGTVPQRSDANLLERAAVRVEPRLPAHALDQELQAVPLLMLVVAEISEHAQHGVGDIVDFIGRDEVVKDRAGAAENRCSSADRDAEAARTFARLCRSESQIVDARLVVVVGAAFETDLELARQFRAERMPQQIASQCLCIRSDVEKLVGGDTGEGAGGDIAHRVAAGLAGRETRFGEPPHRGLDVVQPHEMKLHVLPRRDVPEAA